MTSKHGNHPKIWKNKGVFEGRGYSKQILHFARFEGGYSKHVFHFDRFEGRVFIVKPLILNFETFDFIQGHRRYKRRISERGGVKITQNDKKNGAFWRL